MDITRWAGFFKPIDCLKSYEAKRRVILAMTVGWLLLVGIVLWVVWRRGGRGKREMGEGEKEGEKRGHTMQRHDTEDEAQTQDQHDDGIDF